MVYSPLDCLKIARANPDKQIVFFAIGFETTAPANAMLVSQRQQEGVKNVSILVSHVAGAAVDRPTFCSRRKTGFRDFSGPDTCARSWDIANTSRSARDIKVPIVITGFEPLDFLQGTLMTVRQLEAGRRWLKTNIRGFWTATAMCRRSKLVNSVFEVADRKWRGVGWIPKSGYKLRWEYRDHDAEKLFEVKEIDTKEPAVCISGQILRGIKKPHDCPAFGTACTPLTSAGRDHGFRRRCLRRLLRLRTASG